MSISPSAGPEQSGGQPDASSSGSKMTTIRVTTIPANFLVEVPENATAADIRAAVAKLINIHPQRQSNPADDSKTLSDFSLTGVSNPNVYVSFGATGQTDSSSSSDGKYPIKVRTIYGKEYEIMVTKDTKVEDLSDMIQDKDGTPVDQQRLIFAGKQLSPEVLLTSCNIGKGSTVHLVLRLTGDIGVWGVHGTSPLVDVLHNSNTINAEKSISSLSTSSSSSTSTDAPVSDDDANHTTSQSTTEQVKTMVRDLKTSKFKLSPASNTNLRDEAPAERLLDDTQCAKLMQFIDSLESKGGHRDALLEGEDPQETSDFKCTIGVKDLASVLDQDTVEKLVSVFESTTSGGIDVGRRNAVDMVKLRKVKARPADLVPFCINFHLDYAVKTMSIALNPSSEYEGGRIVYATDDGELEMPQCKVGTALMHDNTWVHGVTELTKGTRYHLFFLQH